MDPNRNQEIIKKIWPELQDFNEHQYENFLAYLNEEICALNRANPYSPDLVLSDAVEIIETIRTNLGETRAKLVENTARQLQISEEARVGRLLDLNARALLTLNIWSYESTGALQPYRTSIPWPDEQSPRELVGSQFSKQKLEFPESEKAIDPAFTAAYLEGICGMKIHWTDNLADHLRYDQKENLVIVYQHKICLLNHVTLSTESIIPEAVLWEAIDTLNLLFPFGDASTRELLVNHKKQFYGLGFCGRQRVLDLGHYSHWGGRLQEIIRAYNRPPQGLRQLIYDRRNLNEWATFWIGVCVAVLTVLSAILGVSSVISTVYSIKQYNLAVAQACAQSGTDILLAPYCR